MRTRTQRDRQADKLSCEAVVESCSPLTPLTVDSYAPEVAIWYDKASPIQKVGYRLYGTFKETALREGHQDLPWMVIQHGFVVVTSGIEKCKAAYIKYCAEMDQDFDEDTLIIALCNPKTVRFFTFIANMPNKQNRCFESYFNLTSGSTSSREFFEEFEYDLETTSFTPNPVFMRYARLESTVPESEEEDSEESETVPEVCPAVHLIPGIVNDTVNACRLEGLLSSNPDT